MRAEILHVYRNHYNVVTVKKDVYNFHKKGYDIICDDRTSTRLFAPWSQVQTYIDYQDTFESEEYIKVELKSNYIVEGIGISEKIEAFYCTKDIAVLINEIYNERNADLKETINFVNSYKNAEIDVIANNFLLTIDDEYMLMPRVIQRLHNKYSHAFDYSYHSFQYELSNPKTKIDKQIKANNAHLRCLIDSVSNIIDTFNEIALEIIGQQQKETISAIVWLAIQKAAVNYFAERWLKICDNNFFIDTKDNFDLKKYLTNIIIVGEIDLTDSGNLSTLTWYVMSVSNKIQTFPSTYILVKDLIKEIKDALKTTDIREKLLNPSVKKAPVYSMTDVDIMDGLEFEQFIAHLFSKMGYSTKITKTSGDQGIDVIAQKSNMTIGIQTKCYGGSVGNTAVQEAVAGKNYYGCDKILVVTNNYFTSSAIELAKVNNVILWDREILKDKIQEFLN